jgi:glycosyltransferase involved in cell wall biosynthesis
MTLIDAIFINNGGGKILLDYLIEEINNKKTLKVHYVFDLRIKDKHSKVTNGTYEYMSSSLFKRIKFYIKRRNFYNKVFCFGNLPPFIKLKTPVITYFHQPLYLKSIKKFNFYFNFLLRIKISILYLIVNNSQKWVVQSALIKNLLARKFKIKDENIYVIPFYPSIKKSNNFVKKELIFLYVSNGEPHKNHNRLLESFVLFYDKEKKGELHLTIDDSYNNLILQINNLKIKGYPIINHGFLNHIELSKIYSKALFFIFPSLTESFGLGIIEALESDCIIIGADCSYMHAICRPSYIFNPESVEDIYNVMVTAFNSIPNKSEQLVSNEVENLLSLLS